MKKNGISEINEIKNNGFYLNKEERRISGLAALSLKIALKAYFSTYKDMQYILNDLKSTSIKSIVHSNGYCEQSSEAIIHFHHFFELICKDILEKESKLLVVDASKKTDLLYKLIKGEEIEDEEQEGLKSIEFTLTIERLCVLIKERNLGEGKFDFLNESREILMAINNLRNRLIHRGVYILNYNAFDKLIGKFILPIVNKIINIPEYKQLKNIYTYDKLSCGLDPIDEIVKEFEKSNYDISKIAFLKELGRSAYNNPIDRKLGEFSDFVNNDKIHRIQKMAETQIKEVNRITKCPVCGLRTLLIYDDYEPEEYNISKKPYYINKYTWKVECINYNFEITRFLKNPKEYGFEIEDYWN